MLSEFGGGCHGALNLFNALADFTRFDDKTTVAYGNGNAAWSWFEDESEGASLWCLQPLVFDGYT